VNQNNDTLKHIDLSCLDYEDAIIIAKSKVKDLANYASMNYYKSEKR
jgi:hypothetical protein